MTEATQHAYMHWRRKWQPTLVFLPGESQGQRNLVGCHLWDCTESDMTEVTQQQQLHQVRIVFSFIMVRALLDLLFKLLPSDDIVNWKDYQQSRIQGYEVALMQIRYSSKVNITNLIKMIRQNSFPLCKQITTYVNPEFSGILYAIVYNMRK